MFIFSHVEAQTPHLICLMTEVFV